MGPKRVEEEDHHKPLGRPEQEEDHHEPPDCQEPLGQPEQEEDHQGHRRPHPEEVKLNREGPRKTHCPGRSPNPSAHNHQKWNSRPGGQRMNVKGKIRDPSNQPWSRRMTNTPLDNPHPKDNHALKSAWK